MSCARRVSVPSCKRVIPDKKFNSNIPPYHNCEDLKEEKPAEKPAEKPCVWGQCYGKECLRYDCFGDFDMAKYRPTNSQVVNKEEKECKDWCYESFGNVLPLCNNPCRRGTWSSCPEPEPYMPPKTPWRHSGCPLFLWTDGYATLNIKNVTYPETDDGLVFKERVKGLEEKIDSREVELWSLCCMRKCVW